MQFSLKRECLLKPLQQVSAPLGSRPSLPILGHLLLVVQKNILFLTSANLEIEISVHIALIKIHEEGSITIPARKFLDICRGLPVGSDIAVLLQGDQVLIISGRSRFSLSTLPASDFPNLDKFQSEVEFHITQDKMSHLIEATQFSMAHQDVRYYLNGILFETAGQELHTVATDGHRLAKCSIPIDKILPNYSVIIPRKGVVELLRLLDNNSMLVHLKLGRNHIRAISDNFIFTSKLIDGLFPDYRRIFLTKPDKIMKVNCNLFKQACTRVSILSNTKLRNIRFDINKNCLKITANNSEQEVAEETLDITYNGSQMEIGLNVSYILDVLNVLKCDTVCILLVDATSRIQIENAITQSETYIIMPMRI
ncbi:DNA polymerase III subunit beta [Candidatus Erwinia haradaeae]|uniref:Beta sliding clamp n=1 Tax=Candidatus Erwinia haradaeae TaxID=1922217 RepID=A0A451D1Q5_9GAMM|nr:DNA polymerase III subunit beta [Candidatus Erwinia haradaeae]VFP79530.1 Beta sliding clamp [Candidatus Erwinia haradaeae]